MQTDIQFIRAFAEDWVDLCNEVEQLRQESLELSALREKHGEILREWAASQERITQLQLKIALLERQL